MLSNLNNLYRRSATDALERMNTKHKVRNVSLNPRKGAMSITAVLDEFGGCAVFDMSNVFLSLDRETVESFPIIEWDSSSDDSALSSTDSCSSEYESLLDISAFRSPRKSECMLDSRESRKRLHRSLAYDSHLSLLDCAKLQQQSSTDDASTVSTNSNKKRKTKS